MMSYILYIYICRLITQINCSRSLRFSFISTMTLIRILRLHSMAILLMFGSSIHGSFFAFFGIFLVISAHCSQFTVLTYLLPLLVCSRLFFAFWGELFFRSCQIQGSSIFVPLGIMIIIRDNDKIRSFKKTSTPTASTDLD